MKSNKFKIQFHEKKNENILRYENHHKKFHIIKICNL